MLPWSGDLAGRIDEQVLTSDLLRGNPLGDPFERPVLIYLPPGYDDSPDRRYPSVYVIQGYGGHVTMWRNRTAFRQPFKGQVAAGSGVSLPGKFGTITRSDGSVQATYDGHPLYPYSGDTAPGQTTGNGINA